MPSAVASAIALSRVGLRNQSPETNTGWLQTANTGPPEISFNADGHAKAPYQISIEFFSHSV